MPRVFNHTPSLLMIFIWYRACNLPKHKHTHKNVLSKRFFFLNYIFLEPFIFKLVCNCLWGKSFRFVVKRQTFSQNHTELQNNNNVFFTNKLKTHYSIDIFINAPFCVFLNTKTLVIWEQLLVLTHYLTEYLCLCSSVHI